MNWSCLFGGHKMELCDNRDVSAEHWHKTDRFGKAREGTDFIRTRSVKIYKCRRCGHSKAELWINNPLTLLDEITVAYAQKLINEAK